MPNLYTSPVGQGTPVVAGVTPRPQSWGEVKDYLQQNLVGPTPGLNNLDASHWGNLVNQDALPYERGSSILGDIIGQPSGQYFPNIPLQPSLNGSLGFADGQPVQNSLPPAVQQALITPQVNDDNGTYDQSSTVKSGTNPGESKATTSTTRRTANADTRRMTPPSLDYNVLGGPSGPVTYTTNGGRSVVSGAAPGSLLGNWFMARFLGQNDPGTLMQKNAQANTMAVRNSQQYNDLYQQALRLTGNPALARAQVDAYFGSNMPGYGGDFANSGLDLQTQQLFDAGNARLNNESMINPNVGNAAYTTGLPEWGLYTPGLNENGRRAVSTSDGRLTEIPDGYTPVTLNRLTGAGGGSAKDSSVLTEYQRQMLAQGGEKNAISRSNALSTHMNGLRSLRTELAKDPATNQDAILRIDRELATTQQEYNRLNGLTVEAGPSIVNSNTSSGDKNG